MSLRLVPGPSHPSSTTLTTTAPSAPGVPDPLRSRLGLVSSFSSSIPSSSTISPSVSSSSSSHPLESRLSAWRAVQEQTRFTLLARQYGLAEPMRRRMELDIVSRGEWRPLVLGSEGRSFGSVWGGASGGRNGQGVHADVLLGREAEIGWEDVFVDDPLKRVGGFLDEVEARVGMDRW